MENYYKDILAVVSRTNLNKDEILDIKFHPLEKRLLEFYYYCKESIKRYANQFKLKETFFLFHINRNQNALAKGYKDCNVILITNGLFVDLNRILHLNSDFSKIGNKQFRDVNSKSNYSLGLLMFEATIIFTFYHEFAHLVQNKEKEFESDELSNKEVFFDQYQHIKEYDSDLCGCSFVINIIEQYVEDNIQCFDSEADRLNLHWLALSSIIITMLLFLNDIEISNQNIELYYKNKKHPHPSVRIHYMIQHYLFNLGTTFKLPITMQDGLNNCFRYCNEFFDNKNIFLSYFEQLWGNLEDINEYCDELFNLAEQTPNLVRHQIEKFQ